MNKQMAVDILLVEDNPNDAELTLRALKKHNLTNNLEWVKDGAEALDFLFMRGNYATRTNHTPKLVLLDLRLPKLDGLEVLKAIRTNPQTDMLPVVVMTSSTESGISFRAINWVPTVLFPNRSYSMSLPKSWQTLAFIGR